MWEQSKSAKRRYNDGAFHTRYFVGKGIDIGGKPDPLAQYVGVFPRMESVRTWDMEDGDAQKMSSVPDDSFDFVHASHCLEHMVDVEDALSNWTRILKPGGHLIVTVPDEDLYELGHWPSRFNADHKWTFTVAKTESWSPRSINAVDLAARFADRLELERLVQHRDFFREALKSRGVDQTMTPVAECAIEIVWRKRPVPTVADARVPDAEFYRPRFSPWLGYGEFGALYRAVQPHTLASADRCWVLHSLARQALALDGEFWECGVYRGGSALLLARTIAAAGAARPLRLFDTFTGIAGSRAERDLHRDGDFSDTSAEAVRALLGDAPFATLHAGRIPQTFSGHNQARIAFAHVDVDVYQSVLDCCAFIHPRLVPGGFMIFDDYGFPTCPGARAAVDEFFREKTAVPLVLPTGQAVVFGNV